MADKNFWLGMLAAALVFGITFVSCTSTSTSSMATSSFEGFWTRVDLSGDDPPEDWELSRGGSLVVIRLGTKNHSWKKEGDNIVINLNDSFAIYNLQIVNDNLLKGTAKNKNNLEWIVELRKIQNPVTLRNKSNGSLAVLGVNGYFILDSATRLHQNLSEDQALLIMADYLEFNNDKVNVLDSDGNENLYRSLFKYYTDDKSEWGFDVAQNEGSIYYVMFTSSGKKYRGVVSNLHSIGVKYYIVPVE